MTVSEEQFSRALIDAPIPIMIHAEDGEVVQVSDAWTLLSGYSREDIPTIADWTEKAYGSRKHRVHSEINRLYELQGKVDEGEYAITTASGEERIWHFCSFPLGAEPGGKRLVVSMARDVTVQRRAEEALRLAHNQLEAAVERRTAELTAANEALKKQIADREKAEKALRDSEQRYRHLFDYAPMAICEENASAVVRWLEDLRASGVTDLRIYLERKPQEVRRAFSLIEILDANRAALAMFGARNVEELANRLPDVFVEKTHETFVDELVAIWEGRNQFEAECQAITLQGERIHDVMRWFVTIKDGQTDYSRAIVTFLDITQHMKAQESVRQSERELKDLFENAAVGIHWVGPDGTILRANRAELDMLGYHHDEYVGRNIAEFHIDRPVIEQILGQLHGGATLKDRDARLRCKDGSIKHVLISSNVLWENGRFVHSRCFTRDITESKQAADALRTSEQRFRELTDNLREVLWLTDWKEKKLLYVSPAYETIYGRSCESLWKDRRSWYELVHPDDRSRIAKVFPENADLGRHTDEEYRIVRDDGTVRWVRDRAYPIFDAQGKVARIVGVAEDVTERKLAEEQARQHQADLAHIARHSTISELAAGLAHELNQPFAAIMNYAGSVSRRLSATDDETRDIREDLAEISLQAERAGHIIRRLRRFIAKTATCQAPVKIDEAIRETVKLLEPEARRKGITIRLNLADKMPVVRADDIQIQQVVLNLVRNSIEAMSRNQTEDRLIVIKAAVEGDREIEVAVTDTGCGIAPKLRGRLFEPFYTTKNEGLGMGLPISRSIIEAHGGRLWALDKARRGSTFRFTLPIEREPSP